MDADTRNFLPKPHEGTLYPAQLMLHAWTLCTIARMLQRQLSPHAWSTAVCKPQGHRQRPSILQALLVFLKHNVLLACMLRPGHPVISGRPLLGRILAHQDCRRYHRPPYSVRTSRRRLASRLRLFLAGFAMHSESRLCKKGRRQSTGSNSGSSWSWPAWPCKLGCLWSRA